MECQSGWLGQPRGADRERLAGSHTRMHVDLQRLTNIKVAIAISDNLYNTAVSDGVREPWLRIRGAARWQRAYRPSSLAAVPAALRGAQVLERRRRRNRATHAQAGRDRARAMGVRLRPGHDGRRRGRLSYRGARLRTR